MAVDSNGDAPTVTDVDRRPYREDFVRQLTWVLSSKDPPVSHRDLAEGLGWGAHTRIYRWLNFKAEPQPHEVFAMERWLGVPHGTLSRSLGYLPPEARGESANWEEGMDNDPTVPPWAKRLIRTTVAEARALAKSRRR